MPLRAWWNSLQFALSTRSGAYGLHLPSHAAIPSLIIDFSIPFAYDQKLVFVGNLNFGHAARTAPLAVSASNSAACSFTAPAFLKL